VVAVASHPTHDKLIDAALRLADERPLVQISVDDIVREAGVAKGTFYVHFPDRGAFLAALNRRFHRSLFRAMAATVGSMPPGRDRLVAGALAYLDACRDQLGVKSILIEARAEPAVAVEAARRNTETAAAAREDFVLLGVTDPDASARLFVAAVAEAALMELEAGGLDPRARTALTELVPTGPAGR
jgi:AcrR family transcriptional regulator